MQRVAIAICFAAVSLTPTIASQKSPKHRVAHAAPPTGVPAPASGSTSKLEADLALPQGVSPPAQEVSAHLAQKPRKPSMEEICATLQAAAAENELPLPFFVRLIWQESRFRANAVSRAGARGIAQFMPGTAIQRGLRNPNDPIQSLNKSADLLNELRDQFGNLGLAAAAYNGGPGLVQAWLRGRTGLPNETRQYVRIITGVPVEDWKEADKIVVQTNRIPARVPCPALAWVAEQEPDAVPVRVASTRLNVPRARRLHTTRVAYAKGPYRYAVRYRFRGKYHGRRVAAVYRGRRVAAVNRRVSRPGRAQVTQVRQVRQTRMRRG